jgi:magnesium transporter
MEWHDIADPDGPELDELSQRYKLHSLHVEDARSLGERAKAEVEDHYFFIVLKVLVLEENNKLTIGNLNLFVGSEFLITVHRTPLPTIESLRRAKHDLRPDEVLHRLMDGIVDSYLPVLDEVEARIDSLQGRAIRRPEASLLEDINEIRATLLELRSVLLNMRHVAFRLQHMPSHLVGSELPPFMRDIHDHLTEDLDAIAGERDRLSGVVDLYLSSVANRNTDAMRTLTILGTAAVPTLVVTSFFGMIVRYPEWVGSYWAFYFVLFLTVTVTALLLWYLKRHSLS